ncbi:hypothetical protein JCM6882_006377 [Rhodosporidiobolus microsporus]
MSDTASLSSFSSSAPLNGAVPSKPPSLLKKLFSKSSSSSSSSSSIASTSSSPAPPSPAKAKKPKSKPFTTNTEGAEATYMFYSLRG